MQAKKNNLLLDIVFSVALPSLILMKLSKPELLGPLYGLIIALLFPLGWGLLDLKRSQQINFIAALGVVSVLLTGGIGLFEIDTYWLAVKEALVPSVFAVIIFISGFTGKPLVRKFVLDTGVFNTELINQKLQEQHTEREFQRRLARANLVLSINFVFSAVMNYVLARWLVTAPTGTEAFNEQLGQMTLLSYPMIALPAMVVLMAIIFYIWRALTKLTGLTIEQLIDQEQQ